MGRIYDKGLFSGVVLGAALLWLLPAGPARGESALRLPMPVSFGKIRALTYDPRGRPNGRALLSLQEVPGGRVQMRVDVRLDSGAHSLSQADLKVFDTGRALRLVGQRSSAYDRSGKRISSMVVDHRRGRAVCTSAAGVARTVALPREDRIVNVPLNLLLRPLVTGEVGRIRFQTFVCGDEVRILDTEATVATRIPAVGGSRGLVELHYRFDMGPVLSVLAQPFLPPIALWFDAAAPYAWAGYRMPLYSDGPVAVVLRRGVRPADLRAGAQRTELSSNR